MAWKIQITQIKKPKLIQKEVEKPQYIYKTGKC